MIAKGMQEACVCARPTSIGLCVSGVHAQPEQSFGRGLCTERSSLLWQLRRQLTPACMAA